MATAPNTNEAATKSPAEMAAAQFVMLPRSPPRHADCRQPCLKCAVKAVTRRHSTQSSFYGPLT